MDDSLEFSDYDLSGSSGEGSADDSADPSPGAGKSASPEGKAGASPGAKAIASPGAKASASPGAKASTSPGAKRSASPGAKRSASPGAKPSASPGAKPSASPGAKPRASPGAAATAEKAPQVAPPPKFLSSIKPHRFNIEAMESIKEETNVEFMRTTLLKNFNKISGYDYLMDILCDIVKHYGNPRFHPDKNSDCFLVISEVARIIDTSHKNWALFDVPLKNQAVLKGSAMRKMIDMSKDKVSQLLRSLDEKILFFEEQVSLLEMENQDLMTRIGTLEEHLENANKFIQDLRGERFHEDVPSEQDFMADLQMELSMREYLNSSLQEQNYKLRKSSEQYCEELFALKAGIADTYRDHLKEVAELCKDMELEEGLRKEVVKKIEDIIVEPDDILEAVNLWMKSINEVIGGKQEEIREMNKKAKKLSDEIAMRQVEIVDLEDRKKDINNKVESLRQETRKLEVEERFFSVALQNQRKRNELLEREAASGSEVTSAGLSPHVAPRAVERSRHWEPPRFDPARSKLLPIYEDSSMDDSSPERHRGNSPGYQQRQQEEDRSMSFQATSPESTSSPFSGSGSHPSRYDTSSPRSPYSPHSDKRSPQSPYSPHSDTRSSHSPYSPHSDTRSSQSPYSSHSDTRSSQSPYSPHADTSSPRSPRQTIAPGTQTYSRAPSEFAPSIRHIDPSTRPLGVTNHIDVGESFNMQMVHSGSPSPYTQVTSVDSEIPEAGPSRMIDSPFQVRHKTGITPDPYTTPFISKSRFGYTDPTAKVLNIPPGAEFDVPTGMRKTVVLTSPKRKEPLVIDIGIDPKPLTQTASGEHFVCDISLAVQQANKRRHIPDRVRFRNLSPVFTFDEPPAVTPTTDRRHGLDTPRGIFQRKHYNIRRVHRPHEYQSPNLPWSPHNLPDAGSPVSHLYPSPNITDTSISWERGPESPYSPMDSPMSCEFDGQLRPALNKTYEKSPSPVIKGRYYQRETPESDSYSSQSPVIKGRYYQRETPESDSYSSQSPMIKGRYYQRETPESDSYSSSSPVIKGPSWMRRSQGQDHSPDTSQSPQLSRTYDMSPSEANNFSSLIPSPGFDRTFESHGENFGLGQSSRSPATSQSPQLSRTYDMSPSEANNFSSLISSPGFDRSFESHGGNFGLGQSFESHTGRPPLYGSHQSSRGSPKYDSSFDRPSSGTYDRSPSPQGNQTFSRSPSPRMNQTFSRSPTSQGNQTFGRSPPSQRNQTFSRSPPSQGNQTFSRTPSPQFDDSFEGDDSLLGSNFYEEGYSPEFREY